MSTATRNGHANGHVPDVSTLREQVEQQRLVAELACLRTEAAQAQILESYWGGMAGWGGWGGAFDPQFGGGGGGAGGAQVPAAYLAGGRQAYTGGRNLPFVWANLNLDFIRGQARWLAAENEIAQGAIRTLRNFGVRTGYTFDAEPTDGYEADAAANALCGQVDALLEEFEEVNEWGLRQAEALEYAVQDGEKFFRTFAQDDGMTLIRDILPEQIAPQPGQESRAPFGIESDPRDFERKLWYYATYDNVDFEKIPAADVHHLKRNVPRLVTRGLSDFFSVGKSVEGVSKLLENMRTGGAITAAIAWIEQYDSASGVTVGNKIAAQRDQNRPMGPNPITGQTTNFQQFKAGTIVKTAEGKKYLPAPLASNTTQHVAIVQAVLRIVGDRWNMPEYMISGDSSNANYASTLVSGSPFVTAIECEQNTFRIYFLKVVWAVIRNACDRGRLIFGGHRYSFAEVRQLVKVHATPPNVAIANKKEESDIDTADLNAGIISKAHRQAKIGVDPAKMKAEIAADPVTPPSPPAGQLGMPGKPGEGQMIPGRPQDPEQPKPVVKPPEPEPPAPGPAPVSEQVRESFDRVRAKHGEDVARAVIVATADLLEERKPPRPAGPSLFDPPPPAAAPVAAIRESTPPLPQPINVTVHIPEMKPANVTVNAPVNVPQQPPATVTVAPGPAPVVSVTVEQPAAKKIVIERDEQGRISGATSEGAE